VAANTITASAMTVGGTAIGAGNSSTMKNRIINGAMVIDQRNAGASVTPTTDTYVIDRFLLRQPSAIFSAQTQTTTTTSGFSNSLKLTVASVQGSISSGTVNNITQYIEGYNIADLGWGTANAKTVTLSFWVQSSVTGTYSTSLYNGGFGTAYVSTYTISTANTWQQVSLTIPGPTSGTWLSTNGVGIAVTFDLGSGSGYNGTAGSWGSGALRTSSSISLSTNSSATFYITGIQLEVGSSATGYEYRQYGQELALCQRYCFVPNMTNSYYTGGCNGANSALATIPFPSQMRTAPTGTFTGSFGGDNFSVAQSYTAVNVSVNASTVNSARIYFTSGSGTSFSASQAFTIDSGSTGTLILSAEL
jgi:hypothetical protein